MELFSFDFRWKLFPGENYCDLIFFCILFSSSNNEILIGSILQFLVFSTLNWFTVSEKNSNDDSLLSSVGVNLFFCS